VPNDNEQDRIHVKEYLERMLQEYDRRIEVRLEAMDKAVELAFQEHSRRLIELNNLRNEVSTDRNMFVTKAMYDQHRQDTVEWRETVAERLASTESKSRTWTIAIGLFVSVINALFVIFYKK